MVSVIITSFKEPKTIGRCIAAIGNRKYSGIPIQFEIIQVSPDKETLDAGLREAKKYRLGKKFIQIKDPRKGKPYALKMAFKKAKGDILILTDGDTHFEKNAVKELLKPFEDSKVGGVGGRPVSKDKRDNMFGYWGHLLSDSAHDKRINTAEKVKDAVLPITEAVATVLPKYTSQYVANELGFHCKYVKPNNCSPSAGNVFVVQVGGG